MTFSEQEAEMIRLQGECDAVTESCRGREDESLAAKGVSAICTQEFMVENDWNVPLHLSKHAQYISFTRGFSGFILGLSAVRSCFNMLQN